jgi:hypothetical protein
LPLPSISWIFSDALSPAEAPFVAALIGVHAKSGLDDVDDVAVGGNWNAPVCYL